MALFMLDKTRKPLFPETEKNWKNAFLSAENSGSPVRAKRFVPSKKWGDLDTSKLEKRNMGKTPVLEKKNKIQI